MDSTTRQKCNIGRDGLPKGRHQCRRRDAGFAALFAVLIMLSSLTVIVAVMGLATLNAQKIAANLAQSSQAYYSAQAGVEDSLYRVIKGKRYAAANSLDIAAGTTNINISDANGKKIITANAEHQNKIRNLQATIIVSTDAISFYYGVQVGEGGLEMENNSQVTGSIYSNGPISGSNGAVITGDAWVADVPTTADQQSATVNADFIFGQTAPAIDAAQSFTPSQEGALNKISLYLKKAGLPPSATVRVLTDNNGKPSKNLVASGAYGTLNASQISQQNYGWVDVALNDPPGLDENTKYWIAIDASAGASNYFFWGEDSSDSYGGNTAKYSPNWNASSPSWSSVDGDLAFKIWFAGTPGTLDTVTVNGDAHANTIADSTIGGDAYYQTITRSAVGGTQHPDSPDPSIEPMPISAQNIADWKNDASLGGAINGNYTINGSTASLGPKKIIGDLTITNGADLTVTGTLYVTGNISISNNAKVRLAANYGDTSGVLINDGVVNVGNNVTFYTNAAGSYLLFLATKTGEAINLSNNTNTVIFYASRGAINVSNNAILKEVTAYKIKLSNNAQVIYESGLASAKFSSGPGATWAIEDWREVP